MKRKLAFIMAAIMLVTTPASVLASESMDVSVVSEETVTDPPEEDAKADVYEEPAESSEISVDLAGLSSEQTASANSGMCGEDVSWVLNGKGTLTIKGTGPMHNYGANLAPWEEKKDAIQEVVIEDGVTSIGSFAFFECRNLKSVRIADTVTSVGERAFYGCISLTDLTVPNDGIRYGSDAFGKCSALIKASEETTAPEGEENEEPVAEETAEIYAEEEIAGEEDAAYYEENVDTPEVLYEGPANEEEPENISLIDGETPSEEGTEETDEITEYTDDFIVSIEDTPTTYSDVSMLDDNIVMSGTCGDNLTWKLDEEGVLTISGTGDMYNYVYFNGGEPAPWDPERKEQYDDASIVSVYIEEGVTSIGNYAFCQLSALESVTLPNTLTSIGEHAFASAGSISFTELNIPDGVTFIGEYAFEHCNHLESVHLPENEKLTEISDGLFYKCSSLVNVNIPGGVQSIGYEAFDDCISLTQITLPEGVTSIGNWAFHQCISMGTISIPKGITYIGGVAFADCYALEIYYGGSKIDWLLITMEDSAFDDTTVTIYYGLPTENSLPIDISTFTVTLSSTDYFWDGTEKKPTVTVKKGSITLENGTDCTISYENNIDIGEATVIITGIGNYFEGTLTASFTISQPTVTGAKLTLFSDSYAYDGTAKEPTVTVEVEAGDGTITLTEGTDYTVSYSGDNINVGKATATVTGIGNYIGTASKNFSIYAVSLSDATLTLSDYTYIYSGSAIKPTVTVTNGSKTLSSGGYTVSYSNNTKVGTATVTVTGNGNYTGTLTAKFTISEANIKNLTITLSKSSYTYDGSAKKPSVTVKSGDSTIGSGNYTVSYSNNTNAGTATVTVKGKDNCTGTGEKNFTINKASQTLTAKASSSSIVKGKTATITASGKGTISYSSSNKSVATVSSKGKITAKAPGKATITVKAAGNSNYKSASKTLTIKVNPKASTLKSVKSGSSKKMTVKWKKVSGVSGYQIQYSTNKNFKSKKSVNVSGASKVSKTISKLKKGKTYYVRLRTYKKVSGVNYYSSWSSKKKVKIK